MRDVITVILAVLGLGLVIGGTVMIYPPAAMVLGGLASLRMASEYAKNGSTG